MVVEESVMQSQNEVESAMEREEQEYNKKKNHPLSSLGRESSIYSLTLDEFQHTLCESGKNFGSMNMDEFLSSIWSAEENQNHNNNNNLSLIENSTEKGIIRKQPSLHRQGSLTIPSPLCRKTVDEVWCEIHKGQQSPPQRNQHSTNNTAGNNSNAHNAESAPRQPTFGEMTLEDFLIKAGVVREQCTMPVHASPHHHLQQHYAIYPNNNNTTIGASFVPRPVIGGNVAAPPYQTVPQGGVIGEGSGYVANGKRDSGYRCFAGRVLNGGGAYAAANMGMAAPNMGMAAPMSPVSPEGMGGSENYGGQFGMEIGALRGRKRVLDCPVEKVVERRQRRMIKNRESAARSRARKQAYTVELEAELNQLKEENAQLNLALAELERRRKQRYLEEANGRVQSNAQKAKKKLMRSLKRNQSCPL